MLGAYHKVTILDTLHTQKAKGLEVGQSYVKAVVFNYPEISVSVMKRKVRETQEPMIISYQGSIYLVTIQEDTPPDMAGRQSVRYLKDGVDFTSKRIHNRRTRK